MADCLVICVGGTRDYLALRLHCPDACPRVGSVYIVTAIYLNCPSCGGIHYALEELRFFDNGYPAEWFRLCMPTDLEAFKARLFEPVAPESPVTVVTPVVPPIPDKRIAG